MIIMLKKGELELNDISKISSSLQQFVSPIFQTIKTKTTSSCALDSMVFVWLLRAVTMQKNIPWAYSPLSKQTVNAKKQ